jgi:FtsP/CotA-like multicopper oxidase with cupredoxin domain
MGQRADLVFSMPGTGALGLVGLKGPAGFPWSTPSTASVTIGDGSAPSVNISSPPTFDLTHSGAPAPDLVAGEARYDVTREIVLGGGLEFRNGSLDFADTVGGMVSPDVPPIHVREGQLVRLHIVNKSQKFHPIHVHGHVFSILAKNGHGLTGSPVHVDAVLVGPHETWDVAFKADNPGIWMLHCHVLGHAAAGMSMTINYAGVSTPFTMGTRSGNVPE